MVQNNKILTVSYGTFSCTLEGFEDSFETMKAIAEYFRDLAREDRYFGAEPPQPDAEMLARIAEREIARQVDARHEDSGIVLTAAPPSVAAPSAPRSGAAPEPAGETMARAEPAELAATAAPAVAEAPAGPAETFDEDKAPVAEVAAAPAESKSVAAAPAEPEPAEAPATPAVAEPASAPKAEAQRPEPEMPMAEDLGQPAPARAEVEDSIAAKLARIRAVVARNEAVEVDEYEEDALAEAIAPAETTGALAQSPQAEDEGLQDEAKAAAPLTWENFAADLGETGQEAAPEPAEAAPEEAPQAASTDDAAEETAEPTAEQLPEEEETESETLVGEDSLFGDLDQEADDSEAAEDELSNILSASEEEAGEAPEAAMEPTARVVKIKKAALEEAIAAGDLEEIGEGAAAVAQSDLPPEAEAELMRELAELEAEVSGQTAPEAAPEAEPDAVSGLEAASEPEAEEPETSQSARRVEAPTGSDADIERLMKSAEERLSDPEATARHEAYSHMRAAVATTRAEREAGGTMGTHTSDDPYRVDLTHAVRPNRPEAPRTRPARPAAKARPAPLKLVAEQRVDDGAGQAARGPIRPRRVSTRLPDEEPMIGRSASDSEFARFASELGAEELPELLEAAAAYLAFVKRCPEFSRPQLMSVARQAPGGNFNREDGLRAFGHLLREGKIEKMGGGRFTVTGNIGFRPGERAAG